MIRVLSPGMQTTVQDLGRPGWAHLGVSASGAADALSMRVANLLVGNSENTPAIEMTLLGAAFEFEKPAVVALAGSDFGAPLWVPLAMGAGETLRCGPTRGGARCYMAVRGGIDVSRVLGSASTHVTSGLGGRPLRKSDLLGILNGAVREPCWSGIRAPEPGGSLRVTPGPQAEWFGEELYASLYRVTEESNRMGLRLDGPALGRHAGHMLTEGVSLGAVQVPPDGRPIILFVEHQTTGGYPKIANVISADLHNVGQLRPRDMVTFELTTVERALALLREQEDWVHSLV